MEKIDYKRVYKEVYSPAPKGGPVMVDVPPSHYLMLDGQGDPEGSELFAASVEALFALAYQIKFAIKRGPMALDFTVMPLEGDWWADDMSRFMEDRAAWRWTLMIMQPPVVSIEMVEAARHEVAGKKSLGRLHEVRFELREAHKAAEVLHVGPFSAEGPSVAALHRFIAEQGYRCVGRHHEIYLSDMRRTAPGKWKSVLRQEVAR